MNPSSAVRTVALGSERRHPNARDAFAGLTPKVVAIVAALMLARVFSTTIDLGVIANGDLGALISSLFASYCQLLVMAAPMLVIIITTANVGPQHGLKRIAALAAAVLLSTILGAVLRIVFIIEWFGGIDDPVGVLAYVVPRYAILGAMLTAVGEFYRHEVASIDATQQADVDRTSFEREMTEARLQVLQAQVEPHFLFNTLANVRRLPGAPSQRL